ncbi:hypothetical protein J5S49_17645 [Virgibacillus halodenitrificans]|uniref:hypothetical protein n=1 Tax=Virgibacillus halodenitrificans TaxID=1482 RepID=UPI001F23BEF1|nr:hypothetical protein [Virgibacillus halodenitrificans]MCG1030109.1 hypothetical protein [Virgibacillus halodenitrificans]
MREKNPNIEFVTSTNIIIVVGKGNSAPIKISEKIDIKLITIQKLTNAFFENLIFLFLREGGFRVEAKLLPIFIIFLVVILISL